MKTRILVRTWNGISHSTGKFPEKLRYLRFLSFYSNQNDRKFIYHLLTSRMTQFITACFRTFEHPLWQFSTYQAIEYYHQKSLTNVHTCTAKGENLSTHKGTYNLLLKPTTTKSRANWKKVQLSKFLIIWLFIRPCGPIRGILFSLNHSFVVQTIRIHRHKYCQRFLGQNKK